MYFDRHVEEAIIEYNNSDNKIHKERIFETIIYPALSKLVENVIHNRKFYEYGFDDYSNVKHDCIVHLHDRLSKYSLEKGKAFSYFNRITINWVFAYQNKITRERTLFPDFYADENSERPSIHEIDRKRDLMQEEYDEAYKTELSEFLSKWADWGNDHLDYFFFVKNNSQGQYPEKRIVPFSFKEQQIANAVFDLCKQCHRIDNYNKKALYFWIRDQIDCKTQTITDVLNVLKPMQKEMYFEFKKTGTKYWHRWLYYPEGVGEWSDEQIEEIVNENKPCHFQENYW